jgi:hypothetical protein
MVILFVTWNLQPNRRLFFFPIIQTLNGKLSRPTTKRQKLSPIHLEAIGAAKVKAKND